MPPNTGFVWETNLWKRKKLIARFLTLWWVESASLCRSFQSTNRQFGGMFALITRDSPLSEKFSFRVRLVFWHWSETNQSKTNCNYTRASNPDKSRHSETSGNPVNRVQLSAYISTTVRPGNRKCFWHACMVIATSDMLYSS